MVSRGVNLRSPSQLAASEPDASQDLRNNLAQLLEAASTNTKESMAAPDESRPQLQGAGIIARGSNPNVLSREARYRLVRYTVSGAAFALALAFVSALLLQAATAAWVAVPVAFIVAAVTLALLAYFTVMGFGKVDLEMQLAPGVTGSNGADGAGQGPKNGEQSKKAGSKA